MSLAAAVSKVGLDVALRQAGFVYQISRQSMTDSDATKIEKMRLSFSNHPIWEKTANARVTKEKRGEGEVYRIDFLYQAKPRGKSKKIKHGKRYATVHEAEGAMFDVRMSKESKKAKAAIMEVLRGNAELEPMPKKVSSVASAGPARKKVKATMKCDHAARTSHRPNRNPNGPGDITAEALANRYGGSTNWVELIQRKRWRIFLTKASRDADIKTLSEVSLPMITTGSAFVIVHLSAKMHWYHGSKTKRSDQESSTKRLFGSIIEINSRSYMKLRIASLLEESSASPFLLEPWQRW